jgi:hypothetical protein
VARYHDYVRQRWEEGEHNIRILLEELRERGYRGGFTMLAGFLHPWRKQRGEGVQETVVRKKYPWYPPRNAMWLVLKPEVLRTPEEHAVVPHLLQPSPPIAQAVSLVQHFCRLVRDRQAEALGTWTQAAESSGVQELVRFAQG